MSSNTDQEWSTDQNNFGTRIDQSFIFYFFLVVRDEEKRRINYSYIISSHRIKLDICGIFR